MEGMKALIPPYKDLAQNYHNVEGIMGNIWHDMSTPSKIAFDARERASLAKVRYQIIFTSKTTNVKQLLTCSWNNRWQLPIRLEIVVAYCTSN